MVNQPQRLVDTPTSPICRSSRNGRSCNPVQALRMSHNACGDDALDFSICHQVKHPLLTNNHKTNYNPIGTRATGALVDKNGA